jgi:hypothetical protein
MNCVTVVANQRLGKLLLLHQQKVIWITARKLNPSKKVFSTKFVKNCLKGMTEAA